MKNVFIAPSANIYGDVRLAPEVNIWFQVVMRGDINIITIGERTNIQDGSIIHVDFEYPTSIGQNVTIGHKCIIHGCWIADSCLIGMGTTILNGAYISENSIVGANSLITQNKHFPPNVLIMGSPAKVIRALTQEEIDSIKQNADNYVLNAEKYRNSVFSKIE